MKEKKFYRYFFFKRLDKKVARLLACSQPSFQGRKGGWNRRGRRKRGKKTFSLFPPLQTHLWVWRCGLRITGGEILVWNLPKYQRLGSQAAATNSTIKLLNAWLTTNYKHQFTNLFNKVNFRCARGKKSIKGKHNYNNVFITSGHLSFIFCLEKLQLNSGHRLLSKPSFEKIIQWS